MIRRALESLLFPPGLCLGAMLAALAVRRRRPRTARALFALAALVLWAGSTPLCSGALLRSLQTSPPLPADGPWPQADAIVVLSAEADREGLEFGGPSVGALTLQRIRYAAFLHKKTGLPVLCSGGRPGVGLPSLAAMMADAMEREHQAAVRWREERSADTWQNAAFSAELLHESGIRRVLLVTHAWHMPRAMLAFSRHGFEPIAAPTAFRGPAYVDQGSLWPSPGALRELTFALHELLGLAFYGLRGDRGAAGR